MPRRKIPKKTELIQLQKLYKTDEKIAERLGNVTPQLVAYWRRKKNIPKHMFAKFSSDEIREIWERYGDDYRCGLELGISKAAFYNWRRRYGYKEKPAFLKLEQLELKLGGPEGDQKRSKTNSAYTMAQKIFAAFINDGKISANQSVEVEPDLAVISNSAESVITAFGKNGLKYVWNPNRIVLSLNGFSDVNSSDAGDIQKQIRSFSHQQKLKHFYEVGEGCGHQLVIENANILPGQLAVGVNSSIASIGAIGALGINISTENMSRIWANGKFNLQIPGTIRVNINGRIPKGVYARDIALFVAKKLGVEQIKSFVIEYYGSTVSTMSVSDRMTLSGMSSRLGALSALIPYDSITRRYISRRTNMPYRPALADRNAEYDNSYEFNIGQLSPLLEDSQIDGPGNIVAVDERAGIPLNLIIIGSETNGRFGDLRVAADIIKGKEINSNVRMLIYPGTRSIYLEALKRGLIRAFIEAGAVVMAPGAVPDLTKPRGLLAAGDSCLATTGFDLFKIANKDLKVYQASPATAAASALKGAVTDPRGYLR